MTRLTTWLVLGTAVALAYALRRTGRFGRARRRRAPGAGWDAAGPYVWRRAARDPASAAPTGPTAPIAPIAPFASDGFGAPEGADYERFAREIEEAGGVSAEDALAPDLLAADALAADPGVAGIGGAEAAPGDPPRDAGELYEVHVLGAVDRDLPEDDIAQRDGENWLEHLEASAAEMGPEPERVLDMVDDSDHSVTRRHRTDRRDIPVADRGSGGPRGL